MKPQVTIVDYGMGNLFSVARALEKCGAESVLGAKPETVHKAQCLVLPGVGAFKNGMEGLAQRGLIEPLREFAGSGKPFLGICLGMQMLFDMSEEFGQHVGLGVIPGRVVAIPPTGVDGRPHKIPHIGWNELIRPESTPDWENGLLRGLTSPCSVYFVHSFTAIPADPRHQLANCLYNGCVVSAAVKSGAVYGCQFHPEKSGLVGLRIVKNFLSLCKDSSQPQ